MSNHDLLETDSENIDCIEKLCEENNLKYPRHLETFNQFIIHDINNLLNIL